MVATEDIFEAFDDLGYTVEDTKIIDKLCSFCDLYGIDQNKLSKEYLSFALKKKYNEPTFDNLEQFESSDNIS